MMSSLRFCLIASTMLVRAFVADAQVYSNVKGLCCLCGDTCPSILSGRANIPVPDESGATCRTKALELARTMKTGTGQCTAAQNKYKRTCCDRSYQPTAKAVVQSTRKSCPNVAQGPEPLCNICPNGEYPTKPNTVTALLYVPGNPTCHDLYCMGRSGNFIDRLCNPAQDYFEKPCGCDPH